MREPGLAEFPDAVTKRGAKRLDELGAAGGPLAQRVMLFLIRIGSAQRFEAPPATSIRRMAKRSEHRAGRRVPRCLPIAAASPAKGSR